MGEQSTVTHTHAIRVGPRARARGRAGCSPGRVDRHAPGDGTGGRAHKLTRRSRSSGPAPRARRVDAARRWRRGSSFTGWPHFVTGVRCSLGIGGHVGTLFRASTCRRQKNARVPPDARSRTVCSRRVVYDMLTHRLHVVVQTRSDSSFASSHSRYMRLALLANATLVQRTWSKTWKKEAHGQVGGPHD